MAEVSGKSQQHGGNVESGRRDTWTYCVVHSRQYECPHVVRIMSLGGPLSAQLVHVIEVGGTSESPFPSVSVLLASNRLSMSSIFG